MSRCPAPRQPATLGPPHLFRGKLLFLPTVTDNFSIIRTNVLAVRRAESCRVQSPTNKPSGQRAAGRHRRKLPRGLTLRFPNFCDTTGTVASSGPRSSSFRYRRIFDSDAIRILCKRLTYEREAGRHCLASYIIILSRQRRVERFDFHYFASSQLPSPETEITSIVQNLVSIRIWFNDDEYDIDTCAVSPPVSEPGTIDGIYVYICLELAATSCWPTSNNATMIIRRSR